MKNQRIIADGLACLMTAFCITSCSSGDILKKFGSLEMQEYLCENFDANEDHKLSAQEVALITEVDLWSDIKSLEGVKYLKNLEDFSFDHCPSATIDLSKNECLRDFSCSFSENLKVIKMPKSIQSIGLYENAQNEKRAEFFVSYYMDYTPWAEAMGYNTDKKHIRTMRVTFTNNDGEWVIDETESTKRNG